MAYDSKYNVTKNDYLKTLELHFAPFFLLDKTGDTIKPAASAALLTYAGYAAEQGVDMRAGIDETLAMRAVEDTLGIVPGDDTTLNGLPVVPFERGMRSDDIKTIWDNVTEEDLWNMNEGGFAVSPNGTMLTQDDIKSSALLYVRPGVYNLLKIGGEQEGVITDGETGLPYEFNYNHYKQKEQ